MALVYSDRTKDTSTTAGTGTYTLANLPPTGFQSFGTGVGDGNTCQYTATDGTDWEVGLGTYTAAGTTLARTLVQASSNSNAAVSWAAGTRTLWVDYPASVSNNLAALDGPSNISITCSVAASALTIALKDGNGNDPTPRSPAVVPFRSATASIGTPSNLTVTAATSLVISSGSTMGFTSAVAGRLWIVAFNDAGTFRLGAVNALSGTSIMYLRDGIFSSTAEGGAGGADSAQVIYTGTAVTSKAMVILGYIEATEATAGTWATAPSTVQLLRADVALPGDVVQHQRTATGANSTGTTTVPNDNTIPQNTEGDQYMSQAITPFSATNLLRIYTAGNWSSSVNTAMTMALFQDSTANALAADNHPNAATTLSNRFFIDHWIQAATTSSTTFKVRMGGAAAGTTSFNSLANGSGAGMGGVMNSFLDVQEIMA